MSCSDEMLAAAMGAHPELHEGVADVIAFVQSRQLPDGQFRGRGEAGDIYYTVFGIDCMLALGEAIDQAKLKDYLSLFGSGEGMDLIHLGCLARCWSRLDSQKPTKEDVSSMLKNIESYRSRDGGYHITTGSQHGSIYGCFLALAAYQDLGAAVPEKEGIVRSIEGLKLDSGLYASERELGKPTTNAAVGAMLMLSSLGQPADAKVGEWLLAQHHPQGGFIAAPGVPVPDLVSTATALYALKQAGADLTEVKKGCINFLGSVWDDSGGFSGNWLDDTPDCEYTFYALLSLGCMAGA